MSTDIVERGTRGVQKLATDVPGLDELLEGGLPLQRATLIAGRSGTCKTVLALQIAGNLAKRGETTLYVTTEERPDDLRDGGESLGFALHERVADKRLIIADLTLPFAGPTVVSGNFDVSGLIARIAHEIDVHQARVLVLDSVSALFAQVSSAGYLRSQFYQLVYGLLAKRVTLIVSAESRSDYEPSMWLGMEDILCDAVIVLRNVIDGKRRRRTIEVQKYRRSHHLMGEFPAALTSDGFCVFPLDSRARERTGLTDSRYPSGIVGLDQIAGGGFWRDSVVLLRGVPGSGKTLLAGSYAVAGALRGERVFYFGFEEAEGMLIRNFEAIGLPVQKVLDAGHLRIVARFPEATSPEDLHIEIRDVLAEYQPSLIVIDSISALEHVTSFESFRQLIVAMMSALREHGRSVLLTQTVAPSDEDRAPYLSTLADAIVGLEFAPSGNELVRSVRVSKLRGSAHSMRSHVLLIGDGGVEVEVGRTHV